MKTFKPITIVVKPKDHGALPPELVKTVVLKALNNELALNELIGDVEIRTTENLSLTAPTPLFNGVEE